MDKADNALFDTWKNEKLSVITEALKMVLEETGPIPIELFNKAAGFLAVAAYESFTATVGLSDIKKIPEKFRVPLLIAIISDFNSVLPDGYPYLVAAICGSSGQSEIRIGCIRKNRLPGAHDIISKKIFPFLTLGAELPDGKYAIKNLSIDRISFSGGENLPEL